MTFVPGLVLCRRFHDEVVGPIVRASFPDLAYAAARLDSGSELFGLDTTRLCLLLSRCYPPYSKWLGTAFARLPRSAPVAEALTAALAARSWPEREAHLCRALEAVATWSNESGLAPPLDATVRRFHYRPFLVLDAGRFARGMRAAITDPWLRGQPLVGSVDQFVDSTDVLSDATRARAAAGALLRD